MWLLSFLLKRKMANCIQSKITILSMNGRSKTNTPFLSFPSLLIAYVVVRCIPSSTSDGVIIMFKSRMEINEKQYLLWTRNYSNQQWCSSVSQICPQLFKPWWTQYLWTKWHKDGSQFIWMIWQYTHDLNKKKWQNSTYNNTMIKSDMSYKCYKTMISFCNWRNVHSSNLKLTSLEFTSKKGWCIWRTIKSKRSKTGKPLKMCEEYGNFWDLLDTTNNLYRIIWQSLNHYSTSQMTRSNEAQCVAHQRGDLFT